MATADKSTDDSFQKLLLQWYGTNRRDLPWRVPIGRKALTPDAYFVLVSELMLQQTQVATVIPYFLRFIEQFPTLAALADAAPEQVLRLWQGLGYYSRARNLQATAREIVARHQGAVPKSLESLLALPGVGRYTAGAIASIAFNIKAPILDGNVARVLCRLNKITTDPRDRATTKILWRLAEEILPPTRAGDFNSAMMELGATICTPRSPKCHLCPVKNFCKARAAGVQDQIPPPRKSKPTPHITRWTFCLRHEDHWLIEQRPAKGRWAGLWQFITIEPPAKKPTPALISREIDIPIKNPKKQIQLRHTLTHRRYTFEVFTAEAGTKKLPPSPNARAWVNLEELDRYPLPRPHQKIAAMLENNQPKKEFYRPLR